MTLFSRFGQNLVDRAHQLGITVLLDVVQSHASKNDGQTEPMGRHKYRNVISPHLLKHINEIIMEQFFFHALLGFQKP
ncbi:hypothetical protein niasHT_039571 [Heterodera trifolii]|uniref:Uncharacterized protein n=1 Tax=Heterodera trifolii TaxID=157864 RepID=A0ABD2I628_9BILA